MTFTFLIAGRSKMPNVDRIYFELRELGILFRISHIPRSISDRMTIIMMRKVSIYNSENLLNSYLHVASKHLFVLLIFYLLDKIKVCIILISSEFLFRCWYTRSDVTFTRNPFRRRTTKFSHFARYVHFCFHRAAKQISRCISEH